MKRRLGFWFASFGISALIIATPLRADAPLKLSPNPDWCKAGYRCLPITEYGEMTKIKVDLETSLKSMAHHPFGFGCAIGPSVGFVVDQNLNAKMIPSMSATCGLAIKWGR
jgi:hypothetical protein